jgi:hypothetical protein
VKWALILGALQSSLAFAATHKWVFGLALALVLFLLAAYLPTPQGRIYPIFLLAALSFILGYLESKPNPLT